MSSTHAYHAAVHSGYIALQDYERVLHEENDDFFADVAEILKPMDVFRDWDSDQVCSPCA